MTNDPRSSIGQAGNGRRRYALVGWPITHSLSPTLHRAAFMELGIDAEYDVLRTPPEGLQGVVEAVRAGELGGANITIPHKETVLRYVDEESETASIVGSANTLVRARETVRADNTDSRGFTRALDELLEGRCEPGRALVLGAGGSARSIVHALLGRGWAVEILARRTAPAERAAQRLATAHPEGTILVGLLDDRHLVAAAECTHLLVNATPVGSAPTTDACLWPLGEPFPSGTAVIDIVAWPVETRLVALARDAGAMSMGGLPMLVAQAAASFELWTGREAPEETMRSAALDALGTNDDVHHSGASGGALSKSSPEPFTEEVR